LPVRESFHGGNDWSYAITTEPGCDCRSARPCRLKAVRAADLRGVQLLQAQSLGFDPASGITDTEGGGAIWGVPGGERVRVSVNTLGRPAVCTLEGQLVPLPAC
jgi:type IV fimbrial biogenesis protein FimT